MKLINSDMAYKVLDKLFANIQRNNYQATQEMFDKAWTEWCNLPTAYNVDEVIEKLSDYKKTCMCGLNYSKTIEIIKSGLNTKAED